MAGAKIIATNKQPIALGSGTATTPEDAVNLLSFQRVKSNPSTSPSALKSPRLQAAADVNLWLFQAMKSKHFVASRAGKLERGQKQRFRHTDFELDSLLQRSNADRTEILTRVSKKTHFWAAI